VSGDNPAPLRGRLPFGSAVLPLAARVIPGAYLLRPRFGGPSVRPRCVSGAGSVPERRDTGEAPENERRTSGEVTTQAITGYGVGIQLGWSRSGEQADKGRRTPFLFAFLLLSSFSFP